MDSNHDKQNQNLLCYRYTTGQRHSPGLGEGERGKGGECTGSNGTGEPDQPATTATRRASSTYLATRPNLSTTAPPQRGEIHPMVGARVVKLRTITLDFGT